jgi:uncharacterized membrane protein YphA (DoxX/SURF4 family)
MSFSEYVSPLIGRFVLAWFFASQAISYGSNWDGTVSLLALKDVPAAPALLALALMVMGLGALSLAFGYQTRYGAMLLFALTIAVAFKMHDFWKIAKVSDRMADYDLFAHQMALAGALLMIVGLGPGGFAIDNKQPSR